jgi:hypothetical protein
MKSKKKAAVKKSKPFDYRTIKTYEDACLRLGIDPSVTPGLESVNEEFRKPLLAVYKLIIIFRAINNGWRPDWGKYNQNKYYPLLSVLSSGFGFSDADYFCVHTFPHVGSRLCTNTKHKAIYIGNQFRDEYRDYLLYLE